jgi:hypothetical protein
MSKKYQKLYEEWVKLDPFPVTFPDWLDQRRDAKKKQRPKVDTESYKQAMLESLKAMGHDYTPHPWSEPVPEDGYYLGYCGDVWSDMYLSRDTQGLRRASHSHWMHMPPSPTEVE